MSHSSVGRPEFVTASKTVLRDIGALQVLIGGLMMVLLLVSLLYQEWYSAVAFLIGGGVTTLVGAAAYKVCEDALEPKRHHAMIVAALGWLVTAAFGALPFIIAAYITPPAVLESFVPTTMELREADNTADAIVQEATQHDFISIGAPEQKPRLEQLVFGSVQETLSEQSEATVLMSRDADRTMRSLYYRWKRGIEAIEHNDKSEN